MKSGVLQREVVYCKFEWLVKVEIVGVVAAPRLRFEKVVLRNFHERSNSIRIVFKQRALTSSALVARWMLVE